jgi:uncharacterized protein (TIGR02266 family)
LPPETTPPVVLRIKVRYEDPDAFVERFAPYVGRAGLFLRSKTPKPVGTEVRFELRLADDKPVLVGMGVVRWAREVDPAKPHQAPGMAIEFTRVTKESRGVILKMLELRRRLSMTDGPRGLPNPPDDDHVVSAAATASATATDVRGKTPTVPPPAAVPTAAPREPMPVTPSRPAPVALEPMAAKPRRASPAELAAAVSSSPMPMADAFNDSEIEEAEVSSVLARARAMVGDDIERELAALLEDQAIPEETDIQDVSQRLASLLGTAPVSRRHDKGKVKADDSVPAAAKPGFAPPPKVALQITADLVAKEPQKEPESPFDVDPDDGPTILTAEAAPLPPPRAVEPRTDTDSTRVVSLASYAAKTTSPSPTEGATRVVNLESLAAASALRDPDSPDEERTKVALAPIARGKGDDEPEDTLDFERPRPTTIPRDFAEESDPDTMVRARPHTPPPPAAVAPPVQARPKPRTMPPPIPRGKPRTMPPPPPAVITSAPPPPPDDGPTLATEVDDDALTPPPVDFTLRKEDSSGSIDLQDLVDELAHDAAPAVAVRPRSEGADLGRSLGGEAMDAEGLIADLGGFGRRTPNPTGPYPDLASFADPPSNLPRRPSERAESLEAALAALQGGDDSDEGEERTSYDRPPSSPMPRPQTESREVSLDDDDDGVEIEIELDD